MEIEKEIKWAWEKDEYKEYLEGVITNLANLLIESQFDDAKSNKKGQIIDSMKDLLDYVLTNSLRSMLVYVQYSDIRSYISDEDEVSAEFHRRSDAIMADVEWNKELIKKAVVFELAKILRLRLVL